MLRLRRSSFRYRSVAADDSALRLRIREITETRIHYGYRRVHVMLRREGWRDNHKRIYRLYSEQGLSLRLKRPRRNKSAQRLLRLLRLLTVIDLYTRECLGICVGQNLRSTEVAEMGRPLTPGNTYGQRYGRVLQRQVAAGMPERELVHVSGGCTVQNRGLAHTL